MNRGMRILTYVGTVDLGPAAKLALDFAGEAMRQGNESLLVGHARGFRTPSMTPLGSAAEELGLPFRMVQQRFWFDPGALGQIDAMLTRFRPELFHSFGLPGSILARRACLRGIAWQAVIFDFSSGERTPARTGWLSGRIASSMLKRADRVLIDSPALGERLARRGIRRDRLVHISGSDTGPRSVPLILENAKGLIGQ